MPDAAPSLPEGYRLLTLGEIDSTNAEAARRAAAGERGPLWIRAETQARGRGRSGRPWTSVPGNLSASLLLDLDCTPAVVHQLSMLAGVAVIEAVEGAARDRGGVPDLRLKWPNDVMIGAAKTGGILLESSTRGYELTVVIGIGLNLASHPTDLARPATHLAAHGVSIAPACMLQFLAGAMDRWLTIWRGEIGFSRVRQAWLDHAGAPGERLSVNTGGGRVYGDFVGIDDQGALILRDKHGQERRFNYGDVTFDA
jgi:BirA family transcriptional regulator, biotin operon repressor / biotin---[acetyl-CoA-carboxylase] ligase